MQGDRTEAAVKIAGRCLHKIVIRRRAAMDKIALESIDMEHLRKQWGVLCKIPQRQAWTCRKVDSRVINSEK